MNVTINQFILVIYIVKFGRAVKQSSRLMRLPRENDKK